MIKYYCDRCGKYIVSGHINASVCVARTYRADLCENCSEEFDKLVLRFIKGSDEFRCDDCKYSDTDPTVEPCRECLEYSCALHYEEAKEDE